MAIQINDGWKGWRRELPSFLVAVGMLVGGCVALGAFTYWAFTCW